MKKIFLLAALALTPVLSFAQAGGNGSALPDPFTAGQSTTPSAQTLYNNPVWCNAGFIPGSVDVGANAVSCYALTAAQVGAATVAQVTAATAGVVKTKETIATSAASVTLDNTATLNYLKLAASATTVTLAAPSTAGFVTTLVVCQATTGSTFTFASPSNFRGTFTGPTVLNKCSAATLTYSSSLSAWVVSGLTTSI